MAMKYNNTKFAILIPLIVAVSVVVGMFISMLFRQDAGMYGQSEAKSRM